MKISAFCVIALAMTVSAFGQTAAPPAPTLTAGAEFKGLRLDWDTVPGATWYQLEYRVHQTGPFVQRGDDLPATATYTRFTFPLHFYDWTYARYRLAACNSVGCTRSAEVSVSNLRRDAVGYFKSSVSPRGGNFGETADLSPDGNNMVVSAREDSETTRDVLEGGAVYVFGRDPAGKWFQRARFPSNIVTTIDEAVVHDVAISASGNTIAVGMPTTRVGDWGGQEGEVDIYHFKNGVWARKRIPRLPVPHFGGSVALDDTGYILAIGMWDDNRDYSVAIYKSINSVWTHIRDLSLTSQGYQETCYRPTMSRDGKTIVEACTEAKSSTRPERRYLRVHSGSNWSVRTDIDLQFPTSISSPNLGLPYLAYNGIGVDRTGDTIAVQSSLYSYDDWNGTGLVKVYKRVNGAYSQVASLTPGAWREAYWKFAYGDTVSVSGDGLTIAVGDPHDNGKGFGPRAAPLLSGTVQTGAVYVYHFSDSWRLSSMVKPNYLPPGDTDPSHFGEYAQLNHNGRTLIVTNPAEASSAKGIDGDWANGDNAYSGAIFMY